MQIMLPELAPKLKQATKELCHRAIGQLLQPALKSGSPHTLQGSPHSSLEQVQQPHGQGHRPQELVKITDGSPKKTILAKRGFILDANSEVLKSNNTMQCNFGAVPQWLLLCIDYLLFKSAICNKGRIFILPDTRRWLRHWTQRYIQVISDLTEPQDR